MLTIEKTVLPSPAQWEIIIEGCRNPLNSWNMSDSYATHICDPETLETADFEFFVGDKDLDLMQRLASGGGSHAKYRRMIPVYLTITAPLYWWKEFDTYKVGTVSNSCSTMHKIHAKEFTLDDFSCEKLLCLDDLGAGFEYDCPIRNPSNKNETVWGELELASMESLKLTIDVLNTYRHRFIITKNKVYWWQMIQLLPTSYNQKRTIMLNYEVLANIYKDRRNHKLDCWRTFCDFILELPYHELITGEVQNG